MGLSVKFGIGAMAFLFSILPCSGWAQSSDAVALEPPTPLLWRDGYINWRGKLVTPNWRVFSADDGTKFAIDIGSQRGHFIAAYIIGRDAFDRKNLFEFNFDCVSFFEIMSNTNLERARIVEAKAKQIACSDPLPKTP